MSDITPLEQAFTTRHQADLWNQGGVGKALTQNAHLSQRNVRWTVGGGLQLINNALTIQTQIKALAMLK